MLTNHKVWASFGFWLNKLSRRNDTYEDIKNFTHLFKDNNQHFLIIIVWLWLLKLSLSDSEICMDDMTGWQICFIMIWSWEMDEFMSLMNWQLLKLGWVHGGWSHQGVYFSMLNLSWLKVLSTDFAALWRSKCSSWPKGIFNSISFLITLGSWQIAWLSPGSFYKKRGDLF